MTAELESISFYVHLPWCVRKCPYCDFNSHELEPDSDKQSEYVKALKKDLTFALPEIQDREVQSIFFGGGTPSLFKDNSMRELLRFIKQQMQLADDCEISLEANPGTAEADRFAAYRDAGVNRLSIGVQSFDDTALQRLGRIHSADEASNAVSLARKVGFDNINLDLMYGLPEQSLEEALADLDNACAGEPEHISWYQLTLEPNTVFYKHPPRVPEEDEIWEIQCRGQSKLDEAGYRQYEISAYSTPGRECQHNLNYWRFGDYLGIGAGAHSKLSDPLSGKRVRLARHRIPQSYMAAAGTASAIAEKRALTESDLLLEFMMNRFRLNAGFSIAEFEKYTGLRAAFLSPFAEEASSRELIEIYDDFLQTTVRGRNHLNELLGIFMQDVT